MSRARYEIVHVGRFAVTIRDLSIDPNVIAMSVTNDAEQVVRELVATQPNLRIFYFDTEGQLDELKHRDGHFTDFAPGPQDGEPLDEFCCPGHQWNMSAGEADENNVSGEGEQVIRCNLCGANGDV